MNTTTRTAAALARIEAARTLIATYTPAQRAACLALVEATTMGRCDSAQAALMFTSTRKIKGTERYDLWTITPSYSRAADILSTLSDGLEASRAMPLDRQARGLRLIESLLREAVAVAD